MLKGSVNDDENMYEYATVCFVCYGKNDTFNIR